MKRAAFSYALSVGVVAVMLAGCGGSQPPIGAPSATSESGDSLPYHKSFYYTGTKQWFRVPAGVTKIDVVGRGAAGGGGDGGSVYGGRGGRVHAVVPVTPGERLAVFVGGTASGYSGMNGGFNGGGSGGCGPYNQCTGLGGGGASDVRQGGDTLSKRIFVAGGGGGRGAGNGGASGGSGGRRIGGSGGHAANCGGGGGTGGTQTSGGAGGSGGSGDHGSLPGGSGAPGLRGDGGSGGGPGTGQFSTEGSPGGGGGGGYFGGGGGGGGAGGDYTYGYDYCSGGGAGGGSSYVEPSAISSKMWSGWRNATGNGLVVFSWQ